MIKKLWGKFLCMIGDHEWTGDALKGIPPSNWVVEVAKTDPVEGFKQYSRMYCDRCGQRSNL